MRCDRIANWCGAYRASGERLSRDGIPAHEWMIGLPFNQFGRALITACPLLILSTTRLERHVNGDSPTGHTIGRSDHKNDHRLPLSIHTFL